MKLHSPVVKKQTSRLGLASLCLIEASDHLIEASDHLIEASDHLIEASDRLMEASDHLIEAALAGSKKNHVWAWLAFV